MAPGGRARREAHHVLLKLGIPTMIITPSETVRREAIERFRVRAERIVAVPKPQNQYRRGHENSLAILRYGFSY
jgi:hypothetical protein